MGDKLRQLPLRALADLVVRNQKEFEPLIMIGARKPSLHFYTRKIILYEGRSKGALVNLAERLREESREGWKGLPINGPQGSKTALIVIDSKTAKRNHWKGLLVENLGEFGVYKVYRIDRKKLENQAYKLRESGVKSDWRIPRPERF